jgi:hypothetical protein
MRLHFHTFAFVRVMTPGNEVTGMDVEVSKWLCYVEV